MEEYIYINNFQKYTHYNNKWEKAQMGSRNLGPYIS